MLSDQTILIGDDEPEVRSYLELALKCQGYAVELAQDGDEVLTILQDTQAPVAAVLLDIVMPRRDGLNTLREIRRNDQRLPVIMVSGASSPINIVEAMKSGATDFITKPVSHEDLRQALSRTLDGRQSIASLPKIDRRIGRSTGNVFFSSNPQLKEIQSRLAQIGRSEAPVLIQGETGAGKEVLARELHIHSARAKKPFLKLNCAALPSELVESELFGYERGAFTGAFQRKPGMFELADGGTLLLDEIGDMDFKLQAKLLQVLQDQEFQRLGGKEVVRVDVRVIAATHRILEQAITENTFREDLYYRLNVINLHIPPLRERKDDIMPLAYFLMKKHTSAGASSPPLPASLQQVFLAHEWPGNIRELENVIRKFLVLGDPAIIVRELQRKTAQKGSSGAVQSLRAHAPRNAGPQSTILEQVGRAKEEAERSAILHALDTTHWNRKQAAALLRIDYKALLYKMKKLSIGDGPSLSQ